MVADIIPVGGVRLYVSIYVLFAAVSVLADWLHNQTWFLVLEVFFWDLCREASAFRRWAIFHIIQIAQGQQFLLGFCGTSDGGDDDDD